MKKLITRAELQEKYGISRQVLHNWKKGGLKEYEKVEKIKVQAFLKEEVFERINKGKKYRGEK